MAAILAGVDGEVIAVAFLFAVLVGVLIVRPLLVAALGNAPVIGGWLSSNVDSALAAWERGIQPLAAGALGALSSTIDWLAWAWGSLLSTITGLAQLAYAADWRIVNLALPALEQRAEAAASSALQAAEAGLRGAIAAEAGAAARATSALTVEVTGLFNAAEADIARLAVVAASDAAAALQAAEQTAAGLAQAERAFVVSQILGVEAEIQASFNRAVALSAAAEAALRGDLGQVSDELRAGIQSEVDSLLRQIEADKAALSAALSGSIAAVAVDIAAIRALRCIQNCSPLGDVGQFLNGLDAAALVAAVAAVRAHPAEGLAVMKQTIIPLAKQAAGGAEVLIGG